MTIAFYECLIWFWYLLGESRNDTYYVNYNYSLNSIFVLLGFLLSDEEAIKYVKRRYKNYVERIFMDKKYSKNSAFVLFKHEGQSNQRKRSKINEFNDVFVVCIE